MLSLFLSRFVGLERTLCFLVHIVVTQCCLTAVEQLK